MSTEKDKARRNVARKAALHLADFLPYRLNVVTQAVSHGLAQHYAESYGISIPEWRVVATAGEFGELTARDIAAHSRMSKVTTSRAVTALLKRKLLARRTNRADRREAFLRLSEHGEEIYAALAPRALAYEARLMEGLAQADIEALDRIVAHFMAKAESAVTDEDAPAGAQEGEGLS